MPNRELALKIVEHVAKEQRRLQMEDWVRAIPGEASSANVPPCGYVCCFGGWACILSGLQVNLAGDAVLGSDTEEIGIVARGLLGLSVHYSDVAAPMPGSDDMFYLSRWPSSARIAYYRDKIDGLRKAVDYFFPEAPCPTVS